MSHSRALKRADKYIKKQVCATLAWILATVFCCSSQADVIRSEVSEAGVVIITNVDVTTDQLNLTDLRAIFAARKRNWENKTPIKVFVLPDKHKLHQRFCKSVLKVYPYVLREQWDRLLFSGTGIPPTMVQTEEELISLVNTTSGAIGYAAVEVQKDTSDLNITPPTSSEIESEASIK